MKRITLPLVILLCPVWTLAQDNFGFPYGKVTYAELDAKTYPADTSAGAYVIKEVAEAHYNYETNASIIFTHHVKIKILKQSAVDQANVVIHLGNAGGSLREEVGRVQASAYNLVNGKIEETKMDSKAVFTERNESYYNKTKFVIPNVRAGTVIEFQYELTSPFRRNFRKFEFQSDIPKMYSEYWTIIPANYIYNITLRGYQELSERKDDVVDRCIVVGNGANAACQSTRWIMKNVPAFKEEEYMTAKENFISSLNFELSEVRGWNGSVDKITKEWKDADEELKMDDRFGQQLRKNRDVFEGRFDAPTLAEQDPLKKAMRVYDLVKYGIIWNERFGAYTDVGIKKALEEKKGNVADINLALVTALRQAGLSAEPVMLATRGIEQPVELHASLTDFNYVIAKFTHGDKTYLLDAVDDFMPFGLIPTRCFNGKGRVIAEKGSYWMDIKPADRDRVVTQLTLKLSAEGTLTGNVTYSYHGYAAVNQRKVWANFTDEKTYLEDQTSKNHGMEITGYTRTVDEDRSKPVVESFVVEINAFDSPGATHFLFNPFLNNRMEKNPFKTEKRSFPVDYGVPLERNLIANVEFPESFEVTSLPEKIGLALPNGGGRYIYGAQVIGNRLSISNLMSIAKPVYGPEEYPYLRELYAQRIQAESTDIIFQKKK